MSAPTENLSKLPGGLRMPPNKKLSTGNAIVDVPVPPVLTIPLLQHAGSAAEPVVTSGDWVKRGQPIGVAAGPVSSAIHASSSGTVREIGEFPIPGRGQPRVPCVVIETDGQDTPWPDCDAVANPLEVEPDSLLQTIESGGIVGLGGAAYPTAAKLTEGVSSQIHTLILNGVECESYISCDDRLMREEALDILRGAALMQHAVGCSRSVIAVESDKHDAWEALGEAHTSPDVSIELVQVPTVYPAGGEDQLVLLLTGEEVPSRGLPNDAGFLVQNVGTAYAVARLIDRGEPLISRIVTVTGEGVVNPGNYRVRLGTSIAEVVAVAGGYNERATRLIQGGPMTGVALTDDDLPVIKATNCLLITGAAIHLSPEPERPCIRCGECAAHCPVRLLPQQILRHAATVDTTARASRLALDSLDDCIECGCCDLVCPSHIPLTQIFRETKSTLRIQAHEKQKADLARKRFEAHAGRAHVAESEHREQLARKRRGVDNLAISAILERAKRNKNDSSSDS